MVVVPGSASLPVHCTVQVRRDKLDLHALDGILLVKDMGLFPPFGLVEADPCDTSGGIALVKLPYGDADTSSGSEVLTDLYGDDLPEFLPHVRLGGLRSGFLFVDALAVASFGGTALSLAAVFSHFLNYNNTSLPRA